MGQGFKHQPADGFEGLKKRLDDLQTQIDSLRTAAGIRNSSISGGSGLTINDGGDITVLDSTGKQVVQAGHDSKNYRGFALTTPSGVDMLDFFIDPSSGSPFLLINDTVGGSCFITDSGGNGKGIAWPWVPMVFGNMTISQWPFNTTGSFVTVSQSGSYWHSQKLYIACRTICDGGATAGQVALFVNGSQVGSSIAVTTSAGDADFGAFTIAGNAGDFMFIEIRTRVTAGAGNCRAQVYGANWVSSGSV